ncbi:hypothetical protein KO500_00235 [Cellulophaga baltica]|uniref:hypothetical protein n=1 Tax=Cellulophaga TaxID=104264 RepID=UPI001C076B6A|nr:MULTISPECIES: hypothetical protein [Cellulophaga]MBU2994840.1 hypothetical protein [Cellulophaga baltica]MDO6766235.1 hypothetical protein [Cellulophaga sp. 1_MG-2023]
MKNSIFNFGLTMAITSLTLISCDNNDDDSSTVDTEFETAQLFASNNSDGKVTIYDMNTGDVKTLTTSSDAAEGIYYDEDSDEIIQASRSSNQLNVYSGISTYLASTTISASFSSSSDVESPRDIAVNGDYLVVADNADVDGDTETADGRLFVYTIADGSITLRNIITTDIALWGIEFVGDDLYAVVDKTNELAVYTSFTATNTTDAVVSASKRIAIEGIVRTHGLAYDNGTMILTDVGDAASDSDGAFHIITDFDSKFNAVADGETMVLANNQVRVSGSSTFLGNPVATEYDADSETVFIAEAANGGGKVLAFSNASAGGDIAPSINNTLASASSLYFYSN